MLFEDREDHAVAAQKEISITLRVDEQTRDYIYARAGERDMSVSEYIRAAVLLAAPQIGVIRGLDRIQLEDMRDARKNP